MVSRRFSVVGMCLVGALMATSVTQVLLSPASAATSASSNLVANGNFAAPPLGTTYANAESFAPGAGLTGWTNTAPLIEVAGSGFINPAPGSSQTVIISWGYNGGAGKPGTGISQVVTTVPGAAYSLKWELASFGECVGIFGAGVQSGQALWNGAVVATYSVTAALSEATQSKTAPLYHTTWQPMQVVLTATKTHSTLAFTAATAKCSPAIGAVSLTAIQGAVTNGFSLLPTTGIPVALTTPYGMGERQALAKLPANYTISSAGGVPLATIKAKSATQQPGGAGVLLRWSISPSPQFLKASPSVEATYAGAVETYLASLLKMAYSDYLAALQAERVPPSSAKTPLSSWWGVEVTATSTTNNPMSLQLIDAALPATTTTYASTGVPEVTGAVTAASVTGALKNLLYYAK